MRIITKPKNKDEEYERLKKKIKDCKPEKYEKSIKEICKKIKY